MTPSEIVAGSLACVCGAEGRLKQVWMRSDEREIFGWDPVMSKPSVLCRGCGMNAWSVNPFVPFQLTEWRRDLVAGLCGAEGRLVQDWRAVEKSLPIGRQHYPVWMDETCGGRNTTSRFVQWNNAFCQGCFGRSGVNYYPWYAVPGVDLLIPQTSVLPTTPGAREPLVRRYCPLEG